jgi:hypothetical protein
MKRVFRTSRHARHDSLISRDRKMPACDANVESIAGERLSPLAAYLRFVSTANPRRPSHHEPLLATCQCRTILDSTSATLVLLRP